MLAATSVAMLLLLLHVQLSVAPLHVRAVHLLSLFGMAMPSARLLLAVPVWLRCLCSDS
jgi:hypothetical protein